MNSCQKIRWVILIKAGIELPDVINGDIIDGLYEKNHDTLYDIADEFREGEFDTSLPSKYDRHYEADAVAAKMPDGSYVGWTYYYGGGKYGNPSECDWMEDAYPVAFVEKQMVVKIWSKAEAAKTVSGNNPI